MAPRNRRFEWRAGKKVGGDIKLNETNKMLRTKLRFSAIFPNYVIL